MNSKEFTELKEEHKQEYLEKKGIKVVKQEIAVIPSNSEIKSKYSAQVSPPPANQGYIASEKTVSKQSKD